MNKRSRKVAVSLRLLALAAGAGLASIVLTGCAQDPAPFDPREAQTWERSTDSEVKLRTLRPLPTTVEAPYLNAPGDTAGATTLPAEYGRETLNVPEGPPVPMSLQEVIHRTVVNNLDIRVASYDTAIDQTRVLEAEANFDPSVFADASVEHIDKDTPGVDSAIPGKTAGFNSTNANVFQGILTRLDQETISTVDVGLRQNLPTGGKIELKQTWTNSYFDPARGLLNPYYQNDLTMQLTQPLLQNFGIAVNRARITIAVNNQRISLLDFRKTLEETVLKVEQTYWQLVQAERDYQTVKNLISASEETAHILIQRGGTDVTAIPIQNALSQTDSRKLALIQLQGHIADLSDTLKQLMNDPQYPISSSGIITPLDRGTEEPLHFNLDDQIETAMENRYELGQQQVRVDSSEIAVDVARNNLLPQLNALVTGGVDGLGSNLGNSMQSEGQFNRLGYSVGLQFVFPLGNRAANAVWQRSLLQRLQAIVSYGALVKTVTLDVKTAARAVDYAWFRLREAKKASLSAEDLVSKDRKHRNAGDVPISADSVFEELEYQQQLASAEQAEHQANNDYNYAIANLEKAKGTLLRYNNVLMEQDLMPSGAELTGAAAAAVYGPGVEGLHQ
jgi:outer membrane protein